VSYLDFLHKRSNYFSPAMPVGIHEARSDGCRKFSEPLCSESHVLQLIDASGVSLSPTLGTPSGFLYPVNMNGTTINFQFSAGSDYLDGTVNLQTLTGGTQILNFVGLLSITSSDLPGYPAMCGASPCVSEIDFAINLGSDYSLEQVYSGSQQSTQGYLSSGQVSPVPEPGSMVLFGSGVVSLAGLLRRRLNF